MFLDFFNKRSLFSCVFFVLKISLIIKNQNLTKYTTMNDDESPPQQNNPRPLSSSNMAPINKRVHYNHVSNIVKSINSQSKANPVSSNHAHFNESSGSTSPTSSSILLMSASSSSLNSYNLNQAMMATSSGLSRHSSSISNKQQQQYQHQQLKPSPHVTMMSKVDAMTTTRTSGSKNGLHMSSSVSTSSSSSSTSSLSASNLNHLNYAEDCASSVFEDDLISNSSSSQKEKLCQDKVKTSRHSFSLSTSTQNYDDDEQNLLDETASTHSSCNLSKLKIQQEDSEFNVLISECQLWIEVIRA